MKLSIIFNRILAFCIDFFFIHIISIYISKMFNFSDSNSFDFYFNVIKNNKLGLVVNTLSVIESFMFFFYFIFFEKFTKIYSIGKYFFRLRLRSCNRDYISFKAVLLRSSFKFCFILTIIPSFFYYLINKKHNILHDDLSGIDVIFKGNIVKLTTT